MRALRAWLRSRRHTKTAAKQDAARYRPRLESLENRELLSNTGAFNFDFGPSGSPVAKGFTGYDASGYNSSLGYGWTLNTGLSAVDNGVPSALNRDFISGTDGKFRVNLPNGTYPITVTLGDSLAAHSNIELLNGAQVLASGRSTAAGQYLSLNYQVAVTNAYLVLEVKDTGSSGQSFAFNNLQINPLPPTANAGPWVNTLEGTQVAFTGTAMPGSATSIVSYAWNFGDGVTATGLTANHTYYTAGTYTVTFTATDALGLTGTGSTTVVVADVPPIVTITGLPASGSPEGTAITLGSTVTEPNPNDRQAGYSYLWTVTKNGQPWGPTYTSAQNFTFTPDEDGTFVVTLAVTAMDGGVTPVSATIIATNVPPTAITNGPYAGVANQPVNLVASATSPSSVDQALGFTYLWNFGDGTTSTSATPSHSYTQASTYTVTLTATDEDGWSGTATTSVTVNQTLAFAPTHGVYSIGTKNAAIDPGVFSDPYVDGVLVRADWSATETAQGVYNWSYLDSQFNAAAAANKKVELDVLGGSSTPSWVYTAGAQAFAYIDKNNNPNTLPVPWDPVFLADWAQCIAALGARYGSRYSLTNVKITGIGMTSDETNLPNSTTDTTNWQGIGYKRVRVENAWQQIANNFAQAFPDVQIGLIKATGAFPPIDDNGNIFQSSSGDGVLNNWLITQGMASFGAQFQVQNNALSDYWISSAVEGVATQTTTGYQMLWNVTGDSTYRMNNGVPDTAHDMLKTAVNSGIAGGAQFLEIYQVDALNASLQDILQSAQQTLG
jgi:PKD repeat protein